jgi:hypothetical protein
MTFPPQDRELRMRVIRVAAAVVSVLTLLTPIAAHADPGAAPSSPGAFVQTGKRLPTAATSTPTAPTPKKATGTPRPATAVPGQQAAAVPPPPPPPTVESCEEQAEAEVTPGRTTGWYQDRMGWCAWGEFVAIGTDTGTGEIVGRFSTDFVVVGYGNNGARQFDYLVQFDDIITDGRLPWETSIFSATFSECADPQPSNKCQIYPQMLKPDDWRLVNSYAATFASPDTPGAGLQLRTALASLQLEFSTPANPEWKWAGGMTVAAAPVRYDSAAYSGRARGAVFTGAPLIFKVDGRSPDQDESARHIYDALHRPFLTFPSWVGKSVPSRLTRMYNLADDEANRDKSRGQCAKFFGSYDGTLQNCDEYPFASTYEGSLTGPRANGGYETYSVRVIDAVDNQYVGKTMLQTNFYHLWRILDGEQFDVVVEGIR